MLGVVTILPLLLHWSVFVLESTQMEMKAPAPEELDGRRSRREICCRSCCRQEKVPWWSWRRRSKCPRCFLQAREPWKPRLVPHSTLRARIQLHGDLTQTKKSLADSQELSAMLAESVGTIRTALRAEPRTRGQSANFTSAVISMIEETTRPTRKRRREWRNRGHGRIRGHGS